MLQYLINTTAIWLISLALFDAFLRRESYHNYNRFYLLFTFLLGALLPLIQWQDASRPYSGTFQRPIEQVITIKQTIVAASAPSTTSINWQSALIILYLAGALVAIGLLIADIIKLITYNRNGVKSIEGGWTIVATDRDHAPFSFMNTLFISNRKLYSDEEWNMILTHEKRHTALLHFIDLLLMQSARIIFWFHPLVYVYNKRLLLVHEFQADNAAARQPKIYGAFLIEQSMLQTAPSLSHSFNRSPIKNRIVMLTRKSSAASRSKMLVFVPLALVCFVCFSKNGFSQRFERNGNKVTYRGNTFDLSGAQYDTIIMVDPVTGNENTKYIYRAPKPVAMNGKPIPWDNDKDPVFTGSDKDLRDYLLKNMKEELSKLKDGYYKLNIVNIIIDDNGKIVYFDYDVMKRSIPGSGAPSSSTHTTPIIYNTRDPKIKIKYVNDTGKKAQTFTASRNPYAQYEEIDKDLQKTIFNKVCDLMETAPGFAPATTNGKKVVCQYQDITFWNSFQIKDHKVYDHDKNGEYKEL